MKIITNPVLKLTEEEKNILIKAASFLTDMGKADDSGTLANFIMDGNWIIEDFNQIADLINEIVNFAKNDKEE